MSKRENKCDDFLAIRNELPDSIVLKSNPCDHVATFFGADGITKQTKKVKCDDVIVIDAKASEITSDQLIALCEDMGLTKDGASYILFRALKAIAQDLKTAGDQQVRASVATGPLEALSALVTQGVLTADEYAVTFKALNL